MANSIVMRGCPSNGEIFQLPGDLYFGSCSTNLCNGADILVKSSALKTTIMAVAPMLIMLIL